MAIGGVTIDAHEEPPWLIVLVASSGGIKSIGSIVAALPKDLRAAVIVLQHRTTIVPELLTGILRMRAPMPVEIYIVRPELEVAAH